MQRRDLSDRKSHSNSISLKNVTAATHQHHVKQVKTALCFLQNSSPHHHFPNNFTKLIKKMACFRSLYDPTDPFKKN